MDEFFSINNLLLVDGAVMLLIGIALFISPGASSALKKKPDSHLVIQALRHTRRMSGILYFTLGFLLCLFGYFEDSYHLLGLVGKLRSLSLVILLYTAYRQLQSGIWRRPRLITLISFSAIMLILYIFFSFIANEPSTFERHEQVPFQRAPW